MALLSDLTTLCAKHRVDTPSTLNLFARRLREAGRLSQKGRGRGAAHMTFLDGSRFLIACAATDRPERATDAEFEFSNTIYHGNETEEHAATLDVELARVLENLADGSILQAEKERQGKIVPGIDVYYNPIVYMTVWRGSVQVKLHVGDETIRYEHRQLRAITKANLGEDLLERAEDYEHATARFREGKNLIAEIKFELLLAVAKLIADE